MASKSKYFTGNDWKGFWITTLISFSVYLFTLAPNVTLEDSGEFLTAAYHWGVPHPPGYPIWTISANLFELIPFGNAAWKGNMMSAFYGALAAGMLCLITYKFVMRLWGMERLKDFSIPGISQETLALTSGIVSGLVFAFTDTMWSQAVITEVYTLNSFFFTLLCLLVLRWFDAPTQSRWPCLIAFFFGLGITNHQTLLVSIPAFLFAMYVANRNLYRDAALLASITCAIFAWQSGIWFIWIFAAGFLLHYAYLLFSDLNACNMQNLFSAVFSFMLGAAAILGFYWLGSSHEHFIQWLFLDDFASIWFFLTIIFCVFWLALLICDIASKAIVLRSSKPFFISFLMFVIGSSFYLYMPLSSYTNPPMNWGYVQTVDGFRRQITRLQYAPLKDQIQAERPIKVLIDQCKHFFDDLQENFSLPLLLLGALPLLFFRYFSSKERNYFGFTMLCFVFMGFVLVYLLNSKFDEQSKFTNRVFYSLAHGTYSFWVGLGSFFCLFLAQRLYAKRLLLLIFLMATLTFIGWKLEKSWADQFLWLTAATVYFLALNSFIHRIRFRSSVLGMVYALPLLPLAANWANCEMRNHDFGWRYGHDMLKTLDQGAVVFGGTDPGRFVPTYMIFVESFQPSRWKRDPNFDRRDLYIITQNAVADPPYMNYIRDQYDIHRPKMDQWYHQLLGRDKMYPKEPLRLPTDKECDEIFSTVAAANANSPGSGFKFTMDYSGKFAVASVEGIEGTWAIHGAITQWIFEKNKAKHTFYVEESIPILWMYNYLEPSGLIMKLNKEPLKELDPKVVQKDMAYWNTLQKDLFSNPAFLRDSVARKSFSQLRNAIGGVYFSRGMYRQAERAFKQSIDLYPANMIACTRLIEMYTIQQRFDEASESCKKWLKADPYNPQPEEVLNNIQQVKILFAQEKEMAAFYEFNKLNADFIFQYIDLLIWHNKWPEVDNVTEQFLSQTDDLRLWQKALELYTKANRRDQMESLLLHLGERKTTNAMVWFNLAAIQSEMSKKGQACVNLQKAIKLDASMVDLARSDGRFNNIRAMDEFQKLVP